MTGEIIDELDELEQPAGELPADAGADVGFVQTFGMLEAEPYDPDDDLGELEPEDEDDEGELEGIAQDDGLSPAEAAVSAQVGP